MNTKSKSIPEINVSALKEINDFSLKINNVRSELDALLKYKDQMSKAWAKEHLAQFDNELLSFLVTELRQRGF